MRTIPQNPDFSRNAPTAPPETLALAALGWLLGEPARAQRYLDVTGLDPDALRSGLGDPAVLASALEFLANHEPDLLGAAEALAVDPQELISALGNLGP